MEKWRDVVGFEGYYMVSSEGRVKSHDRLCNGRYGKRQVKGRMLSPKITKGTDYPAVNLMLNGESTMRTVHSLVAEAFIGPRPEGHEVRHRNGKKPDCRASNLRYATRKRNHRDKLLHGTHSLGSGSAYRLTPRKVREIRLSELSIRDLALKFKCDRHHVWSVKKEKVWNPQKYVTILREQIQNYDDIDRGVEVVNMLKLLAELSIVDTTGIATQKAYKLFSGFFKKYMLQSTI